MTIIFTASNTGNVLVVSLVTLAYNFIQNLLSMHVVISFCLSVKKINPEVVDRIRSYLLGWFWAPKLLGVAPGVWFRTPVIVCVCSYRFTERDLQGNIYTDALVDRTKGAGPGGPVFVIVCLPNLMQNYQISMIMHFWEDKGCAWSTSPRAAEITMLYIC